MNLTELITAILNGIALGILIVCVKSIFGNRKNQTKNGVKRANSSENSKAHLVSIFLGITLCTQHNCWYTHQNSEILFLPFHKADTQ